VSFLLDTNVVSEWVKPRPSSQVVAWLADADEDRVFLSVVSFAEIRHGIELLGAGRRRDHLARWLTEELPARFEGRILPVDRLIAEAWGVIVVRGRKKGISYNSMDALLAATAQVYGFTLVTRNRKDFEASGVPLLSPWDEN
jgi:predicted nucleic acid-binding protein